MQVPYDAIISKDSPPIEKGCSKKKVSGKEKKCPRPRGLGHFFSYACVYLQTLLIKVYRGEYRTRTDDPLRARQVL